VDYYWDWIGAGIDFDYIQNKPKSTYPTDSVTFLGAEAEIPTIDFELTEKKITRMFVGIGPSFRFLETPKSDVEFKLRGGVSFIKGGETLLMGVPSRGVGPYLLNYHAGFDAKNVVTGKASIQYNYFFSKNIGFHVGSYFMYHGKVEELHKTQTIEGAITGDIAAGYRNYDKNKNIFFSDPPVLRKDPIKNSISSFGTYAGFVFRFDKKPAQPKAPKPPKVEAPKPPETFTVTGNVVNCKTNEPIPQAEVFVKDAATGKTETYVSNAKGEFTFVALPKTNYVVYGKKHNYMSQTVNLSTAKYNLKKSEIIQLQICMDKAECNDAIILKNILYDLDKSFIREDAKPELNRLVQFMKDNAELIVELSSHTDSRASDDYNMKLSQRRAQAAVDYIVSMGISRDRLIAKGYGETKLLNNCGNGVKCTEEEHQVNRRTEMKVICTNKK
jgi:outer membrane protein OmpA-like peptidoglycan-associated protein